MFGRTFSTQEDAQSVANLMSNIEDRDKEIVRLKAELKKTIKAGGTMRAAIIANHPLIDTGSKLGIDLYDSIHKWADLIKDLKK